MTSRPGGPTCEVCHYQPPATEPTAAEAIRIIEHSRGVHQEWVDWLEAGGATDSLVGGVEHHRNAIMRYDRVLVVLRRGDSP